MKRALRKQMIELRKNMAKEEVLEKSKVIKERLFTLEEHRDVKNIMFYISYDNEVFTHDMIKDALLQGKKSVFVPVTDVSRRKILVSRLNSWDNLIKGAYGILEPEIKEIVPPDIIDLVIVPGIAFDLRGHRIGHGIGYYDELLKRMNNYTSIGLAFEKQILEKIPNKEYDVAVDIIVTEKRVIDCRNRS
ncbi:MAG: 5-formyltetrahydrofolate cyclo-ligase [Thermoplasmata archaeon]|nr:MAG: 5-formyltetrahydrofolate cyclo-ligase [Thermoplasmata archaeon]